VRYEDFSIHFEPPYPDGSYPVRVLSSSGEGEGTFLPPFADDETAALLQAFGPADRGGASRNLSPEEAGSLSSSLEEAGERLFEALFTGQVRSLLDSCLGRLEAEAEGGLRIKLCLSPEHPDLARLASLPWEILYRRDRQEFLNLSRRTPVVRYLRVPRPLPPVLKVPLRILVALAQPFDAPLLDLEREYSQIEDAARRLPGVEVIPLFHATAASLRTKLLESTFHVLHFMGHGDFDPDTGEGVLLLEDDDGAAAPLPGRLLADLARDFRDLQLLFLNACRTAQASGQDGLDPFAGVATALVLAGVPAVLAMRSPISDQGAIVFSQTFYERLAAGDPADAATSEARLALRLRDPDTLEWATPVLFTRAPEGRLFEPAEQPGPGSSPEIREGILDFSRLLADKTEGFVGRQWLFDAIRQFTREEPRGYFVLRGDPGIGKSALLAQLVKREGYLHHFNVRSEGIRRPETFLRNVCSQLVATYHLEHTFLPPEATRSSLFLSALLEKVSSRLQPGEKAILAVDALDEADSTLLTPGANALYLPATLPPGIYVIVTTRRDDEIPLLISCEQRDLHIDQDSDGNIADIDEYVTSKLSLAGIRAYLAAQDLDDRTFVAELVHKSQGNFMYLRYVLPEIERGAYRDRAFELLPTGLRSYYEDHWKRMRQRDEEDWFAYQLPVLVALTVVKEPVSIDLIQDFSEVSERKRIVSVLKEWDQFLYRTESADDGGLPQKRYRLYHASFQEFIAAKDEVADERVSLAKAHGKIADALLRELYGTGGSPHHRTPTTTS
jgi:hypothetical protein